MRQNRYRRTAAWMIGLALAALLWAAPIGLRQFYLTAWPTQVYYSVLLLGGVALFLGGVGLLFARKWEHGMLLTGCAAALALGLNQATGLAFNTILCFSAG